MFIVSKRSSALLRRVRCCFRIGCRPEKQASHAYRQSCFWKVWFLSVCPEKVSRCIRVKHGRVVDIHRSGIRAITRTKRWVAVWHGADSLSLDLGILEHRLSLPRPTHYWFMLPHDNCFPSPEAASFMLPSCFLLTCDLGIEQTLKDGVRTLTKDRCQARTSSGKYSLLSFLTSIAW